MAVVVKTLPNNWLAPDTSVRGEVVAHDDGGFAMLRCPDGFYWIEVDNEHGRFVSARKDLCLSEEGFSKTLTEHIAMYRRFGSGDVEFLSYYHQGDGTRRLLTAGHKDSLVRMEKSFEHQLSAVAFVGTTSLLLATAAGGISPQLVCGYFLAAVGAWLFKRTQTAEEVRHADNELRSRLSTSSRV